MAMSRLKVNLGTLAVESTAFKHGGRLPDACTIYGAGTSPPLSWTNPPEGTMSFALVAHDLDAPLISGFTHWVLYGIPADVHELAAGSGSQYVQGLNGRGATGWLPVSPPPGHGAHHIHFTVYAVGDGPDLPAGLSMQELLERIDARVINQARIVGTYSAE